MCIICIDLEKERLTAQEAWRNLGEMKNSIESDHYEELKDEISQLLIDEYIKSVYPYVYEMHNPVELCDSCQWMKKTIIFLLLFPIFAFASDTKTKFYDFDDLLINGEYKKPQVLYIDADSQVRFERLLKLKKNLLIRLRESKRDHSLR